MQRAYDVLREEPPDESFATLTTRLAGSFYFAGDVPRCAELVEQALDLAEALGMHRVLTNAIMIKAMVGASGRHPEEARGLFQLSLDLAQKHELREEASRAASNLSDLAFRRDRYTEALGHLEQAAVLAKAVGSRPHEWFALSESTYPLYMLGRWDEAMAAYHELPEEMLPTGGTLLSPLSSILEIHVHRGDVAAARRLLAIYARLGESVDVQERAGYAAANACVLHAEGRHPEAVAAGLRTVEFGETLGLDGQDAKMGFMWALEAAIAMGDRAKAHEIVDRIEAIPPGLRPPSLGAHAEPRPRASGRDPPSWRDARAPSADAASASSACASGARSPSWSTPSSLPADGRGDEAEPLAAEARPSSRSSGVAVDRARRCRRRAGVGGGGRLRRVCARPRSVASYVCEALRDHGGGRGCALAGRAGDVPRRADHPAARAAPDPRAPARVRAGGDRPRCTPARAWPLATPSMRSTTTRADWRQGSLPVFPYPVALTGVRHPADHRRPGTRDLRPDAAAEAGQQRRRRGVHDRGAADRRQAG